MDILSATVARASDFVVFLKVLIIISSMLVFTSSELISTSSELISTSSELISTNSELISTIAEQNFLQRAACHQFAAKYGSQYCFHFLQKFADLSYAVWCA